MRILHLHWGFPPIIGGVETHLMTMLPTLARRRNKISLITGSVEGVKNRYTYNGVKIYRTPTMDLNWLFRRGFIGLESEIEGIFRKVINKEKPEIIHAHNMHYFSKMHSSILHNIAKEKGVPLLLTAHNVWDDVLYLELVKNINWTHIIAVSHFIKRELSGIGCQDTKITVIHHGIDINRYRFDVSTKYILKKYPQLKGRRIVFHPARMGLGKGCDISIKALNIIKEKFPDVLMVLAGTKNIIDWGAVQQKDIAYIVGLIKMLGLQDHLLIDAYSLDEIVQLYGVAEVCIYPSTVSEPFGLTMLESLSASKPMVVTNAGGMPEIIQDGINGYVVPIRDYEALAMRTIQLLDNTSLRKRLGTTGRQIVKSYYTKEIMTTRTLDIYRKILGKRKK